MPEEECRQSCAESDFDQTHHGGEHWPDGPERQRDKNAARHNEAGGEPRQFAKYGKQQRDYESGERNSERSDGEHERQIDPPAESGLQVDSPNDSGPCSCGNDGPCGALPSLRPGPDVDPGAPPPLTQLVPATANSERHAWLH